MPPPPNTKPENVLKRAQELIGVGQQQAALTILHEHVTSKRTRNSPIASLEPVMLLFIELCVDLRKGKMAKDGLYNYKNTSQNTNVATIETVFRKFIELAEQKVTEAQAKAEEVAGIATDGDAKEADQLKNVIDLEATETPESIILSTVSGEQSRDRTDRVIVTPWLKFLWETYRTVLDIFKNNARLEVMYQTTAHQAFQFCLKYTRKTEFRRLCELLRNHLTNAAKYSSQMHAINLSDPDTLQRHLDTRFDQLNVAVELELWQEAFKSVEDTHTLISLSKRPAKNNMMANYFEKLARIFLRSDNHLFHAAAWSRYYNLLSRSAALVNAGQLPKKDNPTNISEQDLVQAASFVVLSALAIPVISTSRSRGALVDVDDAKKNSKNSRLTNLLFMSQAPTRAILFKDALSKDLLRRIRPEIRQLYNILEVEFHPLSICRRIAPILAQIGADPEMAGYVQPLQQVILTRLFQQLSQVYETVQLDFVLELAQFPEPFQMSRATIEKFIMNGCKKGDLAIRIDHTTGVLTFDSDVFASAKPLLPAGAGASTAQDAVSVQRLQSTPGEIVRSQLTRLAKALYITCQYVDPTFNEDRRKALEAAQKRAAAGAAKEHMEILARRKVIEKKKETAATAQAAREREEATAKRIRARKLQEAEVQRLADEQKERELKRLRAEQQRVQREEMEKQLQELKKGVKGVDIENLDLDDLDTGRIRAMKLAALEKEKNEMGEKLRVVAKRLDHLERAYRKEEIKHMPEDARKQNEMEKAAYELNKAETISAAEASHKADVELKRRLERLVSPFEAFRAQITQQRASEFEKRRNEAERELNQKIAQRKREHRERVLAERRQRELEERQREESERREREEAEQKEREEAEKRERLEREKAERAKSREEAAAAAQRQREREEEAERKLAERRAGKGLAAPPIRPTGAAPTGSATGPPQIGGKSGGWRERLAAKEAAAAAGGSPVPTRSDAAPSSRPDTYVPASRREGASAAPGSDVPPAAAASGDRWQRRERPEPSAGDRPAATDRWQPRARQDGTGQSPANGSAYRPPLKSNDSESRGPSAAAASEPSKPGAYRPGAFKQRQQDAGAR